jgi:hypothetical protein
VRRYAEIPISDGRETSNAAEKRYEGFTREPPGGAGRSQGVSDSRRAGEVAERGRRGRLTESVYNHFVPIERENHIRQVPTANPPSAPYPPSLHSSSQNKKQETAHEHSLLCTLSLFLLAVPATADPATTPDAEPEAASSVPSGKVIPLASISRIESSPPSTEDVVISVSVERGEEEDVCCSCSVWYSS